LREHTLFKAMACNAIQSYLISLSCWRNRRINLQNFKCTTYYWVN